MRVRSRRRRRDPVPLPGAADNELCCSFCGKAKGRVDKLIAGPEVYICDRCVRLCVEILEAKKPCRR